MNQLIETELLHQYLKLNKIVYAQIGAVEKLDEITWVLSFSDFPSFKGLVPWSAAGVSEQLMFAMVGQDIAVILKGIDIDAEIVACSRLEAVDKVKENILSKIELDQIIEAKVVAVTYQERKPVLNVDVGRGVLVEMPRGKAVTAYCKPLSEQYRVGQDVMCKVMSIDPLELSIRDARPDPWSRADFRRGSIISGTVYTVQNEKIFVEPDLTRGILGLAPIPMMGDVEKGTRVRCKVRYFCSNERKLHLYLTGLL